jgi:hypothetical protein
MGSGTLAISVRFCAGGPVRNIHRAQGVCSDGSPPQRSGEGSPETPPEPPFRIATLGRGSRLRDEPDEELPAQQWRRLDRRAYP